MSEYIAQPDIVDVIRSHDTRLTDLEIGPRITWTPLTLLNGWVRFSTEYPVASYMRDALGFVHLQGSLKGGATSLAFILPVGYRPLYIKNFPATQFGGTAGQVAVYPNGQVLLSGAEAKSIIDVSPAYFLAEQ